MLWIFTRDKPCTTCEPDKLGHALPLRLAPAVFLQNDVCWMKINKRGNHVLISHVMRKLRKGARMDAEEALAEFDQFLEKEEYDFDILSMQTTLGKLQSYCFKPSSGCIKYFVTCAVKYITQGDGKPFDPEITVRLTAFGRLGSSKRLFDMYRSIGFEKRDGA